MPGDVVLTYGGYAGFTCAHFIAPSSQIWGWLDDRRLRPLAPPADPPLSAWAGDWHEFDDHIRLTVRKDGGLRVDGGAYGQPATPRLSLLAPMSASWPVLRTWRGRSPPTAMEAVHKRVKSP